MNTSMFTWDAEARVFHAEAYEIGWLGRSIAPAAISLESLKSHKTTDFQLAEANPEGWLYKNEELDLSVLIFK